MPLRAARSRVVFSVMAVLMVIVAALVAALVPREFPPAELGRDSTPGAMVRIHVTIDSIEAARGFMKIRLAAGPVGPAFPAEGVTIVTNVADVSTMKIQVGSGPMDISLDVPFVSGEIAAYPFDRYRATMSIRAVVGAVLIGYYLLGLTDPEKEKPEEA